MNKLLFLSCFLLLISIKLTAQQQRTKSDEPPKKASKIIVLVKDSANTLLDRIIKELFGRGYTIDTKDEKLKLLTTKEKSSKKYSTLIKIRASVNDTAIIFTGLLALGFDIELFGVRDHQPSYSDVSYYGAKKSPLRDAWNEIDAIARTFGDKIVYSK